MRPRPRPRPETVKPRTRPRPKIFFEVEATMYEAEARPDRSVCTSMKIISIRPRPDAMRLRSRPRLRPNDLASRPHGP